MCGRYYIDQDVEKEIGRVVQNIHICMGTERTGDIYPSQTAPVICGRESQLWGTQMKWGFCGRNRKLLINARAETAMERSTFSESVRQRRCIIPAKHFYEWDGGRQKVTFRYPQKAVIYMAGFYQLQEDGPHFIILTTAANNSVRPVHERMPLILEEGEIRPWIWETARVDSFLKKSSPLLELQQEYRQMSLFTD